MSKCFIFNPLLHPTRTRKIKKLYRKWHNIWSKQHIETNQHIFPYKSDPRNLMEWLFLTFDNILTIFLDKNSKKKWPKCRGSTFFRFLKRIGWYFFHNLLFGITFDVNNFQRQIDKFFYTILTQGICYFYILQHIDHLWSKTAKKKKLIWQRFYYTNSSLKLGLFEPFTASILNLKKLKIALLLK